MDLTPTRAARTLAALASLTLLAACSTTVSGTGRPAVGAVASPTSTFQADSADDAHAVWDRVVDATTSTGGSVTVKGTISGAGVGGADIEAVYGTDEQGNPLATVDIVTPEGGSLAIRATGGSAWAQATAEVYEEYGYADDNSEQAGDKQVELTDDDSGLDVYSALDSFLDLCGPDENDPASVEDDTYEGQDVLVVIDEKYSTKNYVDPATGHLLASVYDDETVTFEYGDTPPSVEAPDDADVVSVPGF